MTEAWIEIIDDDAWLAALFGASGELTGREHLEKFGDLVSMIY